MNELGFELLGISLVLVFLVPAAYIDWKHRIIPNKLLPLGVVFSVVLGHIAVIGLEISPLDAAKRALIGLIVGTGTFILAQILSRGGVGMGDVKAFGVIGLMLGGKMVLALSFYTVLLASVFGVVMLVRKKITAKTGIPMAPFALAGAVVMLVFRVI